MEHNTKQLLCFLLIGSLVLLDLVAAETETKAAQNAADAKKVAVVLVRNEAAGETKPDIYLGWLDWNAFKEYKPMLQPFLNPAKQVTEPISDMFLKNVPGAQEMYQQYNNMGNQAASMLHDGLNLGNVFGTSRSSRLIPKLPSSEKM